MKEKETLFGFKEKEYCPIVREKTCQLLKILVQENKPKRILEIGTFLGYSAGVMLEACQESFVVSLEKDAKNAENACKNLTEMGFAGRFEIVNCDALDFLKKQDNKQDFDFIFLDGPKGQYIKYLPYLKRLLKTGGILIADDILFYGLVKSKEKIEHKHRTIVTNLRKFVEELKNSEEFETKFYDFEDGVSISIKK